MYQKDCRVQLVHTDDDITELKPGDLGTVLFVDDNNTVHIKWDNGELLGMLDGKDKIQSVDIVPKEIDNAKQNPN